jgi:uncharacterized protein YdeI (YjbR/CyaY-like superfamily)
MLDGETRLVFDSLPRSQKRRHVDRIVQARKPETREHRVATTVQMLHVLLDERLG